MYPHVEKQAGSGFTVNGFSYDAPDVPVLLQILNGANVSELVPAGSIYGLEANKSVELTIPAGAAGGPVSILDCR
jgi:iron transport multicopper oxidase